MTKLPTMAAPGHLRSFRVHKDVRSFSYDGSTFRLGDPARAEEPTHGLFDVSIGHDLFGIAVSQGSIIIFLNQTGITVTDRIQLTCSEAKDAFVVLSDGIVRLTGRLSAWQQPGIANDPTPFVSREDSNIVLAVAKILSTPERRAFFVQVNS